MKIICVGLNYRDHAIEMNRPYPDEPIIFLKPDSSILINNKPFFIPVFSGDIHYEAEVVLKICRVGRSIAEKYAHRYYEEITIGIDLTARDLQKKQSGAGMPWEISKSFDGSAPVGRFIPWKGLPDKGNISFMLNKNGERVQSASTSDMIFGFDSIIAYVSKFFTLKTGDLIFTGTPSGVGKVNRNDRLTGYIEGEKVIDFNIK